MPQSVPHPADEQPGWRVQLSTVRPGLWLAVTLMVVAAVYGPSLAGEFVWDDTQLVGAVEDSLAKGSLWDLVTQPFWTTDELDVAPRNYYRPLTTLTFALDSLVHGDNSAGFRATNLFLHLLNAALLFQLCRRFQSRAWVAALLVACWALQPRLAESVAWISGRTDTLCGTFVLGVLLLWQPTTPRRLGASALLFLALLAKETAIAAALAVVVLELSTAGVSIGKRLQSLAGPMVAMAAYSVLRVLVMRGSTAQQDALPLAARPLVALEALGTYAWMLLDPWQPRTQIGSLSQPNPLALWGGVALLSLGAFFLVRERKRISAFHWPWLVLAVVPLALVSHAVPIPLKVVAADRFLYLPTMALALFPLCLGYWSRRYSAVAPALLCASLIPAALSRAPDWSDPIRLWTSACLHPSSCSTVAMLELGNLEIEAGNFERAGSMFATTANRQEQDHTADGRAATNLALTLVALGRYPAAQTAMASVVERAPRVPKFWYDLGTLQLRNGDFSSARRSLEQSLQLMPSYADAAALLGSLSTLENGYRVLQAGGLSAVERAIVRTQLGLLREAEGDWLAILGSVPAPSEAIQDQALTFIAQKGSARAVSQVLAKAELWQQRRPEIFSVLSAKHQAAQRLSAILLERYGIQ